MGINWDTASIRFNRKTDIEVNLPMPGRSRERALPLYHGRKEAETRPGYIPWRKAPFCLVSRAVCREALDSALPDRNVPGSGFHVMRKHMRQAFKKRRWC